MKAYSIYDSKAEAFNQPFFAEKDGLAIRIFTDHVNNPESIWGKYPHDFTLFHVGHFDSESGSLEPEKTPRNLGMAIEFTNEKQLMLKEV
mgnify:CR=1 FL=1